MNAAYFKARRKKMRALGQCYWCRNATSGGVLCVRCSKKNAKARAVRYKKLAPILNAARAAKRKAEKKERKHRLDAAIKSINLGKIPIKSLLNIL